MKEGKIINYDKEKEIGEIEFDSELYIMTSRDIYNNTDNNLEQGDIVTFQPEKYLIDNEQHFNIARLVRKKISN